MHGAYITHHLLALRAGQRLPGWRDLAALLSGGMRQRVGFARAIVSDPVLLLMDEPFSALDVLTAETLRTDFMDLWVERRLPTEAVLLVTHNIEEAVLMCDRILVLGSHPGQIAAENPHSARASAQPSGGEFPGAGGRDLRHADLAHGGIAGSYQCLAR